MASQTGQHRGAATLDVTSAYNPEAIAKYNRILSQFFSQRLPSDSRWLDIGCGYGEFIEALQAFSFGSLQCTGCEPNVHKKESAAQRGLDVSFFDLESHPTRYDYISLLNVYSHLPDPVEALGKWKRLLKPRGHLFLETGHSAHLPARDHHKPYYLPDHLSFANREIVQGILERIGFRVIKTRLYRASMFPESNVSRIVKELLKCFLRRKNQLAAYFPKCPNRDMYILAQRSE